MASKWKSKDDKQGASEKETHTVTKGAKLTLKNCKDKAGRRGYKTNI